MRASLLPALFALPVLAAPSPAPEGIAVRVDRRFELMSIVFRLAGFREYRMGAIADYNAAVDAHFGPFGEHAAVRRARDLRRRLGYDAIPHLALRARDARGFQPAFDFRAPGADLDARWEPEAALAFLEAMAAFARDTKAEAFFASQEPFYRKLVEACRTGLLAHLDQAWFRRTFGASGRDAFTLVVAPLNGTGNYGGFHTRPDGGRELFAFLGTPPAGRGALPVFDREALPILVHEFTHSFTNPWAERHLAGLRKSIETLASPVRERLRQQAYPDADTVLKESMVRAFTLRYFRDHGLEEAAAQDAQEQLQRGFYWVPPLADGLGDIHAEKGHRLEEAAPRLTALFQELARKAPALRAEAEAKEEARQTRLFADAPKLLALEPGLGTREVDPASTVLRLTFDRPMGEGRCIAGTGEPVPEVLGEGSWDADRKVLSLPVRLRPATAYRFWINHPSRLGFRDQAGRPLRPIQVTFTTRSTGQP